MARFLQQLLDAKEPLFSSGLHQLEIASGHSSVDVRVIADVTHNVHKVMRLLGLDVTDTTSEELYHVLNSYIQREPSGLLLYNTDYSLISLSGQVISMNLIDVIENYHHELPFAKRCLSHARRSLRGEIVNRYINHARTDEVAVRDIAESAGLLLQSDSGHVSYKRPKTNESSNHEQKEKK